MTCATSNHPGEGWYAVRFRVRYAETDAGGMVHHSRYLPWFEEGRSELGRRTGAPYRELESRGIALLVVACQVRYHSPARYDQPVVVWTRLTEARSRRCVFEYQVVAGDGGGLIATGSTEHVPVNLASGRPVRLPEPFLGTWKASMTAKHDTGRGAD